MAWDSRNGNLINLNSNETFFTNIMKCLNTTFGKTTSYKYGLFKSILDNLYNADNYVIKYEDLVNTFSKIYWNIIVKYKLPQKQMSSQGNMSSMEILIEDVKNKYLFTEDIDFDFLKEDTKIYYINKTSQIFNKYVVGALYSDLNGKIYGFSKKDKIIYFSKESYEFLSNNKNVLEKLNYYSWIIWTESILEKKGLGINNVALKLDLSTKRKTLDVFKKQLFLGDNNSKCFYCGCNITTKSCHIDHFVPWHFVKNDKIWNLVPSCSKCNLSKNDKIPTLKYLEKIIIRNAKCFGDSYEANIIKLYNAALYNGYLIWDK